MANGNHKWCGKYCSPDIGLFVLRVVVGLVFLIHGWMKWGDIAATVAFFGTLGLPAIVAYFVTALEFLGGIGLILGAWTHWFGKLLAIEMLVAIYMVKWSKGLVGGYELELVLLAATWAISALGPGKYSWKGK